MYSVSVRKSHIDDGDVGSSKRSESIESSCCGRSFVVLIGEDGMEGLRDWRVELVRDTDDGEWIVEMGSCEERCLCELAFEVAEGTERASGGDAPITPLPMPLNGQQQARLRKQDLTHEMTPPQTRMYLTILL